MEPSILKSIKAVTGYEIDEAFDVDIAMHINTAFATLTDLGVGPRQGFEVTGVEETWEDFFGEPDEPDLTLNRCKTYIYLKVRSYFDPPGTSYHLAAHKDQMTELEHRILTAQEQKNWRTPVAAPGLSAIDAGGPLILDGGAP